VGGFGRGARRVRGGRRDQRRAGRLGNLTAGPYLPCMQFILLIIIGAAAGFIATRAMKLDTGLLLTIAIGVLGAVLGSVVLRFLIGLVGMAAGFVGAVLGAALLIWLWQTFVK